MSLTNFFMLRRSQIRRRQRRQSDDTVQIKSNQIQI